MLSSFLFFSLILLVVSRSALRMPASHGFYRFFAWEAILGLIIIQGPFWFDNPFSRRQMISWTLLVLSIVMVVEGLRLLKKFGRPDPERQSEGLIGIEKTSQLVTSGLYQYIRHPLYTSLLCLAWGAFFKNISLPAFTLAGLATGLLTLTARVEEKENCLYWGDIYRDYMVGTKMFIPFLI